MRQSKTAVDQVRAHQLPGSFGVSIAHSLIDDPMLRCVTLSWWRTVVLIERDDRTANAREGGVLGGANEAEMKIQIGGHVVGAPADALPEEHDISLELHEIFG